MTAKSGRISQVMSIYDEIGTVSIQSTSSGTRVVAANECPDRGSRGPRDAVPLRRT